MKRKTDEKDAFPRKSSAKKARYEVVEDKLVDSGDSDSVEEETTRIRGGGSGNVALKQSQQTYRTKTQKSSFNEALNGKDDARQTDSAVPNELTPSKRGVGRPRGPNWTPSKSKANGTASTLTRGTNGKKSFSTPLKTSTLVHEQETPTIVRNADRSARRKSARNLVERNLGQNSSDLEDDEDELARDIYGADDVEDEDQEEDLVLEDGEDPITLSKPSQKSSKSARTRKRSPTPPVDLPPYELYFFQNRPGRQKTSDNTLSSMALLDHEEYFSIVRDLKDQHAEEILYLQDLHSNSFNRWQFELSQGFSICIYGWGSKRSLLTKFAEHIYNSQSSNGHENNKIVIVNGYTPTTTFRDIFHTITTAVLGPCHNFKLGSQPTEMLESLLSLLTEAAASKAGGFHLTIIVNSIDAPPLRRPLTQNLLSRLASHLQISLIASADHPSFPLLWDSSLRSTYDFIFHDCTSFQPFEAELDVVNSVHELLGRSGRRVGGKEGVSFVLKSLPENAKKLFGVLVAEQLAGMDGGAGGNNEGLDDDDGDEEERGPGHTKAGNVYQEAGVEYRVLYQKAVEEFICSAEMGFRTLLKEFYDHQMIESRKDALGTEILSVPFRKEELETILEDLMT